MKRLAKFFGLFVVTLSLLGSLAPRPTQAAVIGADNRTRTTSTTAWPYRAIVYIKAYFPKLKAGLIMQGTGTMIGAETVLTAGHVIYNASLGGYANKVVVIPGFRQGSAPYGTATANRLYTLPGYTKAPNYDQDLGVIKLSTPIGNKTGWLNAAAGAKVGTTLTLAGYSGDLGGKLGIAKGQLTQLTPARALYQMDATAGASGAPLYNGANQVEAVHTAEGAGFNNGTRLTANLVNQLANWRDVNTITSKVDRLVYVASNHWNRYRDFHFGVVGTTSTNQVYHARVLTTAWNGSSYYGLYNNRGTFMGYVNTGDFRNVTVNGVNRYMHVRSRTAQRWNDIYLSGTRGTTNAYYGKSVYITNRYVNGVGNRAYYSVYTKKGGTWIGFVATGNIR